MEEATAEMSAKYPEWNFDPYGEGVKKWTQTRAASQSIQRQRENSLSEVLNTENVEKMNNMFKGL